MAVPDFNAKAARAKRPCPLWVDAFQRDTQHLGADEVGAYMLVLMAMWTRESCDFPDDDRRLAQVSRVSLRLWKARIGQTIRQFLLVRDGAVISKRLREEAAYVEAECQKQSDRKRGAYAKPTVTSDASHENAENSYKSLEYIDQASTADISAGNPRHHPSQQPNNPTEETGRGVAQARDPDPPPDHPEADGLQWRIIHALGFDRGQVIPKFWMSPDAPLIIGRWQTDLGLSDAEIVDVARQNSIQHGEPARGPKILVPAMQAYAAAKNAPPLQPSEPRRPGNARQSEQRAFDTAVHRLADGLAAGTVHLDTASRDPWEYAKRNGGS